MKFRSLSSAFALVLCCCFWLWVAVPAFAYDNPDLLPAQKTPVIDLAKLFSNQQVEELVGDIDAFETETGYKLRVLTQNDRTPGRAVKQYWGLDDNSLLVVADPRGGNILNYNVGDAIYRMMPRGFWIELQTRFGNMYYVRDRGEDAAVIDSLQTVRECIQRGGCTVVPGLPREQWLLTLVCSILGGAIAGFAAQPRKPEQSVAWQWALIFSPLWGILFIAFGLAPVITRTSELIPVVQNSAGFLIGALVAFLTPVLGKPPATDS
jgi:hypothetical protein